VPNLLDACPHLRGNICVFYRLRGGRGKHSGYSGGPWPNEVREQPDKEPEESEEERSFYSPLGSKRGWHRGFPGEN